LFAWTNIVSTLVSFFLFVLTKVFSFHIYFFLFCFRSSTAWGAVRCQETNASTSTRNPMEQVTNFCSSFWLTFDMIFLEQWSRLRISFFFCSSIWLTFDMIFLELWSWLRISFFFCFSSYWPTFDMTFLEVWSMSQTVYFCISISNVGSSQKDTILTWFLFCNLCWHIW
jgi:hypothetical protein